MTTPVVKIEYSGESEMPDALALIIASGAAEMRERWGAKLRDKFVVHEAAECGALEHLMAVRNPCVLVLDVTLPGLGGVEGLPNVQQLSPSTKTIVLSDHEIESEGVIALAAGAKGYYTRAIDAVLLGKAVEAVSKGEVWVKRTLVHAMIAALISRAENRPEDRNQVPNRRRLECLTQRQREVAAAIAKGASNKEIARRLNVTERTVKAHLTEMFRNVGVLDRLNLALLLNDVPGTRFESAVRAPSPTPRHSVRPRNIATPRRNRIRI